MDENEANVDENESAVKESFLPQPHHEVNYKCCIYAVKFSYCDVPIADHPL